MERTTELILQMRDVGLISAGIFEDMDIGNAAKENQPKINFRAK